MECPICTAKTSVKTTRTSSNPRGYRAARVVDDAVSWYSQDWVARIRSCKNCGWSGVTVEMPVEDLEKGWRPTKCRS